ncbi:hypothetical protein SEVIR_2G140801v4 [Setaria viridis]
MAGNARKLAAAENWRHKLGFGHLGCMAATTNRMVPVPPVSCGQMDPNEFPNIDQQPTGHIFPRSPAEGSNGCDVAALPPPTGGGAPRLAQLHLTRWGVHLCGGHSGE